MFLKLVLTDFLSGTFLPSVVNSTLTILRSFAITSFSYCNKKITKTYKVEQHNWAPESCQCSTILLIILYIILYFLKIYHLPFWAQSYLQLCIFLPATFPGAIPLRLLGEPLWGMIFHLRLCAFSFVLQWCLHLSFSFLEFQS